MAIIKKFKNGKILVSIQKNYDIQEDKSIDENIYHDDFLMSDLYINQINGYQYLVDYNTSTVYELGSYLCQNPLKGILEELQEKNKMYFFPLSKKQSKSLLEDLDNGY